MTAAPPPPPPPDAKDWTWILREPCPECGFDPAAIDHSDVPGLTRAAVVSFQAALAQPGAAVRPSAEVWSALEYGCHVRDVCRLFDERLRLMLSEHDPVWADWNQDATAVESRYWTQQPATVAAELAVAGERIASAFTAVTDDEWSRPGRRSNGSVFTVDSFSRYFGHDVVHHVHDIGG